MCDQIPLGVPLLLDRDELSDIDPIGPTRRIDWSSLGICSFHFASSIVNDDLSELARDELISVEPYRL